VSAFDEALGDRVAHAAGSCNTDFHVDLELLNELTG